MWYRVLCMGRTVQHGKLSSWQRRLTNPTALATTENEIHVHTTTRVDVHVST